MLYFLEEDERAEETFRKLVDRRNGDPVLVEEILLFYYLYFDHVKVSAWLKDIPSGYSKEIIEALLSSEVAGLGTRSDEPRWWQAAIDAAERATHYRPQAAVAHAIRGIALLRGQGKVEAGEAAFARARELAPNDGVVLHYYAAALNGTWQTKRRALDTWEAATRLSPWFPYAWDGVGDVACQLGDHEKGDAAYRRSFELDPANWCDRVFYAKSLRLSGRYDEGERQLQEAVRTNPRSAFAWGQLGAHYAETFRGPEALAACERAMHLDATDEFAPYSAGKILERLGRPHDAESRYRQVVTLDGRNRGRAHRKLAELLARQARGGEALETAIRWLRLAPAEACKEGWLLEFVRHQGLVELFLAKATELEDIFQKSDEAREVRDALAAGPLQTDAEPGPREATLTPEWPEGELERLARGETLRLNCGGEAVEPVPGERWLADRFFTGGQAVRTWVADVQGTERDAVYLSHRFEQAEKAPLEYCIPLPPGKYRVRIHFAETWYYVSGQRRFTATVEGSTIPGLKAPLAAALVRQVEVDVMDGALNVRIVSELADPLICGLEIERSR